MVYLCGLPQVILISRYLDYLREKTYKGFETRVNHSKALISKAEGKEKKANRTRDKTLVFLKEG